jgi:hypothetical protein
MSGRRIAIWAAGAIVLCSVAVAFVFHQQNATLTLSGVVLKQDPDPRKQLPIPGVKIAATEDGRSAAGVSDSSGLFRLNLLHGGWRGQSMSLSFQHPGYQPLEVTPPLSSEISGQLFIVRMRPHPAPAAAQNSPEAAIREAAIQDVRVRYAEKTSSAVDVGSTARMFEVPNIGNVPCAGHPPCSPDGKWKAAMGGVTLDAGQGQGFEHARVSCIAGPCPFTRIETGASPHPGRIITVRVRNWSDTVTFLVEAEVTRDLPGDAIRQAYPAIYGRSLSFTLPSSAEGPSIEAELGGADIVFPLGPALQLSWADCTLQVGTDQTKLYRCELKPSYRFQ